MTDPIYLESPENKPERVTLNGWLSRTGNFFHDKGNYLGTGDAEAHARLDGCTHDRCKECGQAAYKHSPICSDCQRKNRESEFASKPASPWDGEYPIMVFDDGEYCYDEDDVESYCEGRECKISDVLWCPCTPDYGPAIDDGSLFEEHLPSESFGDIPAAVFYALRRAEKVIEDNGPYCWHGDESKRIVLGDEAGEKS